MPQVAVLGDTHVPSRAGSIPGWIRERTAAADHVVFTGDFDRPEALTTVDDLAAALTAVRGNMDPGEIDLPEVATLDVEGVRFVLTHGTGSPHGWADRVVETARERADPDLTTVAVAGHTHEVVDREVDGVRLLNPGSATGAPPADGVTMMTVEVDGSDLEVTVHRE